MHGATLPFVGKLQAVALDFRMLCTGTLVGQPTVLTAAHCVYNPRTGRNFAPGSLQFLIGYNGSRYAGHAIGIKLETGPGYDPIRPYQTRSSDWALISLDTKLGSADRVLPMISEPPDVGSTIMLGGYQQDHPLVLMADTECRIVGRVTDAGGRLLLRHNCTRTSRQRRVLTDRERRQMVHGGGRCGRRTRCCHWASRRPRRSSRRL